MIQNPIEQKMEDEQKLGRCRNVAFELRAPDP